MVKINKKINEGLHDRKFNNSLKKIGKVAQKQVLPAVVSTAIPLASTALGAVATTYGGPMAGQFVQGMSQELMNQYIPDKYQSNNKYVNMFGDALNQGIGAMNGDVDPYAMMNLENQFMGQVSHDLTKPRGMPKQEQYYQPPPQYQYQRPVYNPDNPYQDLIQQLMNKSHNALPPPPIAPNAPQPENKTEDFNAKNDALYKGAEISGDNMTVAVPPYQQMEGSIQGLLGAGISKRKRGRPKNADQVQKIQNRMTSQYNKKMKARVAKYPDDDYPELSRAPNPSLEQYLGVTRRKTKKKNDEELVKLVKAISKFIPPEH